MKDSRSKNSKIARRALATIDVLTSAIGLISPDTDPTGPNSASVGLSTPSFTIAPTSAGSPLSTEFEHSCNAKRCDANFKLSPICAPQSSKFALLYQELCATTYFSLHSKQILPSLPVC